MGSISAVIISRVNDRTDTSFFGHNYLATTAEPGAFAALGRLNRERFAGAVHLVSKCGERIEARTREWLTHHGFFEATDIAEDHLHFCRTRPDKAPICRDLGITHFVDDRLDVLGYLTTVDCRILFRGEGSNGQPLPPKGITVAPDWQEVLQTLLGDPSP